MKLVKLSVFALTLGIFATSCGGGNAETPKTDSAAMAPAPAPAPAPAAVDTAKKMDSAAMAPAAAPAEKK
jgi:hypothetical protein